MFLPRKIAVVVGLSAAALISSAAMSVVPASAAPAVGATVAPAAGAIQCDGNLCIQRTSANGLLPATIKAWARNTAFTGHFELIFPGGSVRNSATKAYAKGAGVNFTGVSPGGPGYEMVEWTGSRSTGTVGFSI